MGLDSYRSIDITLPVESAGATGFNATRWPYPGTHRIESIYFTPAVAVTANDTNYADLSVDVGATEIASEQTTTGDTGNLVAGTAIPMALLVSGTSLELSQGDVVKFTKTHTASGVVVEGTVTILCKYVQG